MEKQLSNRDRPGQGTKRAVALRYRPDEQDSPILIGKGEGRSADRLLQIARDYDIPIRQDPDLVKVLSQLDLESEIPPKLFTAVAQILSFVYQSSRDYRREMAESYLRLGDRRSAEGDSLGAQRSWRTARELFLSMGEEEEAARLNSRVFGE